MQEWLDNAFSTNILAYQNRYKQIIELYGDLYTTEILDILNKKKKEDRPKTPDKDK